MANGSHCSSKHRHTCTFWESNPPLVLHLAFGAWALAAGSRTLEPPVCKGLAEQLSGHELVGPLGLLFDHLRAGGESFLEHSEHDTLCTKSCVNSTRLCLSRYSRAALALGRDEST